MTSASDRPMRYAAVVIIALVLASLLVPAAGALNSLGYFGKKTYLLVLQDNSEIRNTGGYLAYVGTVDVQDGAPKNLKLQYSDTTHANTTNDTVVKVDGPESFTDFYNTQLVKFRDMNVQYDFATFAPLFAAAYTNLTGQHTDGVIALDLTALQELLKTTGPLKVGNEVVTWRTVIDRVHYLSVSAKDKAEKTDLTAFLTELASKLIATVQTADPVSKLLLLGTFHTLGQQRHLLLYAPGALPNRYDGAIQRRPGDYLYVVDSNYAGDKADLNVNRTFTYHTHIEEDGTQTSNLTITYVNNCWWDYKVFTTALVPKDAQLLDARYSSHALGPLVTASNGLTAISSWVVVAPHSAATVTYTYTLPATAGSARVFGHYNLYVQKQAGIDHYTLNTEVTLPHGAQLIRESNVGNGTVSNGDVQVAVIYR